MRPLRILALALAVTGLVALAPAAVAHVSVQPSEADRGSDVTLTFRVPNERDDAATVELAIELPVEFERVEPGEVPGWTAAVEEGAVRWTGGRIEPEQRQEFPLTVGPLPGGDDLVFRAAQTYDSGEVVRWVDDSHDADHPAPTLTLTGEAPAPTTTTTTTLEPTTTTTTVADDTGSGEEEAVAAEEGADDDDGVPVLLLLGMVVIANVVAAVVVIRRRSRRRPSM